MVKVKQGGAALLLALLIVLLTSTIAVLLIEQRRNDITRTQEIFISENAYLANERAMAWAKAYLKKSWEQHQADKSLEKFPISMKAQAIASGMLSATLNDAQDGFNINNLIDTDNSLNFQRLLRATNPDLSDEQITMIANAVWSWVNQTANRSDDIYLQRDPPYRAAHRALMSSRELLEVNGMTPRIYQKLLSSITVLPTPTAININSATAGAFTTLSENITLAEGKQIVDYRRQHDGFNTLMEFLALPYFANQTNTMDPVVLYSDYFLLNSQFQQTNDKQSFTSLLQRSVVNGHLHVKIIWQAQGRV